jgi:hypothetical protein
MVNLSVHWFGALSVHKTGRRYSFVVVPIITCMHDSRSYFFAAVDPTAADIED